MIARLVLLISVLLACMSPAHAQAPDQLAVERLFREPVAAAWFTPEFLAAVPAAQVGQIAKELQTRHGGLRSVAAGRGRLLLRFERAEVPGRVVLDGEGRIAGLWFEAPIPTGQSVEEIVKTIAALPGETSVLVLSGGRLRASHRADVPLAVGSTAKLAILKAAADAAADGRLAWERVVKLEEGWRSLPSGMLQDWPAGAPVTVATLANLMISISDNTATDALVHLVGRGRVEAVTSRNAPFPTTRELFVLKSSANSELRRAWRAADAGERRRLLDRAAALPLPAATELDPAAADVEWLFSASELCALLDGVAGQPALRINPGLARREDWRSVAFKGGSEPGVLNYATRLVGTDGTSHCAVATWNHPGLDERRLQESYRALLRALRD